MFFIKIFYTINGTSNDTIFTINILPLFYYSVNTFLLNFDNSGNSISGFVFPKGGRFTISGFLRIFANLNGIATVLNSNVGSQLATARHTRVTLFDTRFARIRLVFPLRRETILL